MKAKKYNHIVLLLSVVVVLLQACASAKFVPDGETMLDNVMIESDTKEVKADKLMPYVRQRSNSKWFSLFKIPLGTYNLSGSDSTRWINRKLREIGESPVLFDTVQANLTCANLTHALRAMGYMRAKVDYEVIPYKQKKIKVKYKLHTGDRFMINRVRYDIQDSAIARLLTTPDSSRLKLRVGVPFVANQLDEKRKSITRELNNHGYFNFHKDFIDYSADTIAGSRQIDLTLHLREFQINNNDTPIAHTRYTINHVNFTTGPGQNKMPLRQSVLKETSMIEPGKLFCADDLQRTYNNFGRMQIVKYTNIKFTELPDHHSLDCDIAISSNKINSISFQPEGTNTAGDLGAAASLTYENRNLFRGAETFSVKLRGAFEAITGLEGYQNQDYKEYNIESKLTFPRFLMPFVSESYRKRSTALSELGVSYNMQNRPEFHRRVFAANWRYRWSNAAKNKSFKVDLLDLNYIYMPWISPTFKKEYLDDVNSRNSILRYNYEDLFIMKLGFGVSATYGHTAMKINLETAGNVLNGLSQLIKAEKNQEGQHTLFNIAFAQYAKGDLDCTHLLQLDNHNALALHIGLGIAYPYGNSKVLPFEKRYFSGGANSVRGWSVRGLGPGSYKGTNGSIDFINQTGDLKLDLNAELRSYLFWKLYGALFVDAGNIWTLRKYEEQPGGQFKLDTFYRQLAVAYGLGLRLNFDFFILRFDFGMKAINPAYSSQKEHYAIFHPDFSRDFAFHFAVGLPF